MVIIKTHACAELKHLRKWQYCLLKTSGISFRSAPTASGRGKLLQTSLIDTTVLANQLLPDIIRMAITWVTWPLQTNENTLMINVLREKETSQILQEQELVLWDPAAFPELAGHSLSPPGSLSGSPVVSRWSQKERLEKTHQKSCLHVLSWLTGPLPTAWRNPVLAFHVCPLVTWKANKRETSAPSAPVA